MLDKKTLKLPTEKVEEKIVEKQEEIKEVKASVPQSEPKDSDEGMHIKDLKSSSPAELVKMAEDLAVENPGQHDTQHLRFSILKQLSKNGMTLFGDGTLEILPDGFGFLRAPESSYVSGPDDLYLSPNQIRRYSLKTGDSIEGEIRAPRKNDKFFALHKVTKVNNIDPDKAKHRIHFDNLTPLYPDDKINLEIAEKKFPKEDLATRVIDLVAPQGKGQRSLIVAPPKAGKTVMLQNLAHSIKTNHPDIKLIVLLIDERPEEVTDMERSVKGEVVSSTFDEPATRHVQVAEMVLNKAKRMVEYGDDVVILLDSITRLARAYNTVIPSSGKVLTGGVDANALQKPKRFFGAARNIENGGSLTIISTALVDTGSRMDEVIFEEFKGTGNSEIILDRKLADQRIFPAIDVTKSGTRKEDLLVDKDDMQKMWVLRRILQPMGTQDAMKFLLDKIKLSDNNKAFFKTMNT